jgi:enoyl-[acyl-carrier protein] reductase I
MSEPEVPLEAPPALSQLLAQRRGLILGVSSPDSLGYWLARYFRASGAEVAVSVRPGRDGWARCLREEHGLLPVELEAANESSFERAVSSVGERFGRLDFLVHTLVHVPEGALSRPITSLSGEELATAMDIGVRSLLVAARFSEPWLLRSASPRIVCLLSAGADFAMPNYHVVGLVKAALGAANRYLAAELGPKGVLCNALSCSILPTRAAERVIGGEQTNQTRNYLAKRCMTKRALELQDVAASAAFLASPLCSQLAGEVLNVDGGFSRSYF